MSAQGEFPFPKLLAYLESDAQRVEFMKVANEIGLSRSDIEIGKLLLALQLYKAYFATIPREIKAVHQSALNQIRELRDEIAAMVGRTSDDAAKLGEWAGEIHATISTIHPEAVAEVLHKRLLEEAMAAVSGSAQALASAYGRIDKATATLNAAASQAEASIQHWQIVTLRRVWICAFGACSALTAVAGVVAWLIYAAH